MLAVTVEAAALKKALPLIKSLVLSRTTIPILQCVRIEAKNSAMTLEATNLDQACRITVPANGEAAWCLNFAKLQAVLSAVPDGAMIGFSGDSMVTVQSGKIKANIGSMSVDDFPNWSGPPELEALAFEAPADRFGETFARVAWACDDVRRDLKGVHVASNTAESYAQFEATNGHVMSRVQLPCKCASDFDFLLDPVSSASISALAPLGDLMKVYCSEGRAILECGNGQWTSKLLDATFPAVQDYVGKIKSDSGAGSVFDTDSLAAAVKAAHGIDLDRKDKKVSLKAGAEGSYITGFGEAGEKFEVPIDCECNAPFEAWVAPQYLLGILGASKSKTVEIAPASNAILLSGDAEYFGLVMQLRSASAEQMAA